MVLVGQLQLAGYKIALHHKSQLRWPIVCPEHRFALKSNHFRRLHRRPRRRRRQGPRLRE